MILTPHCEGIEENEVLRVPLSDVVFNVQFAIEIALVLGLRKDSDVESGELQPRVRKHCAEDSPGVASQLVQFEPMPSCLGTAEPPRIHNCRSSVPLERCVVATRPHRQRTLRSPLHVV
jgi:hypothetical protein